MASHPSRTGTIVVVMSDAGGRAAMLRALSRAGYSSICVTDVPGAVEYLQQTIRPPATIMVDAGIQRYTLRELLRALASLPGLAAVPVYLIQKEDPRQLGGGRPD